VQVLESSPWDWMLFRNEGKLFFTVLCGSVAMYSLDIQLSESEVTDYDNRNREALVSLATKIRMSPESYSDRHIKNFHDHREPS
jgi:hypothetical protein